MLKRILQFDLLLLLILLAGTAQYAGIAFSALKSGKVALWNLNIETQRSVGWVRYVKDLFVVLLSAAWMLVLPKFGLSRYFLSLVRIYFLWISGVVVIGASGFLLGYSPFSFLPAGLRWLLLLHAAFGVFILSRSLVTDVHRHVFIFRYMIAILLVDAYIVALQFNMISRQWGMSLGEARLTGLFNNAAVAAYFAIAIALISLHLNGVALKNRIGMTLSCMLLAISSGSRSPTMSIFLVLLVQIYEVIGGVNISNNSKKIIKLVLVPISFIMVILVYQVIIQKTGRGDAITQQFVGGGRVANLISVFEVFSQADSGELFFGRGLGVGTNTAITSNIAEGIAPSKYRFNMIIDNAFITGIFQFGLLGSLLFWWGIFRFIALLKPKYSIQAKHRFFGVVGIIFISFIAGNSFEHFFLMLSFAVSLGSVYWSDRLAYLRIKAQRL